MISPPSTAQGAPEERPFASQAVLYVLYHELSAHPGLYKYALRTSVFRDHLSLFRRLRGHDHHGLWPAITFDDGHLSNFDHALPLLADSGLRARFFITAGWTGQRPEYMDWGQLEELARAGHTIGAHGWSHKLLTHCTDAELDVELGHTRDVLQQKLGFAITELSLPGGRYNTRVLAACRRHGYGHIFTSVPRAETLPAGEILGRLNLRSDASAEWLEALLASPTGPIQSLGRQYRVKAAAQRALGDALYSKLWAFLNRANPSVEPPDLQ